MRKFCVGVLMVVTLCTGVFAQTAEKNKIGGTIGLPFGLSYSRKLSDLIEFDLLAGIDMGRLKYEYSATSYNPDGSVASEYSFSGSTLGVGLSTRLAPLFRAWEGSLGKMNGKFSLGPAFSFFFAHDVVSWFNIGMFGGIILSAPMRFELDFSNPFNLFFELTPVGVQVSFKKFDDVDYTAKSAHYYARGCIGLRYRF
ncbi:MAG: hypothetical protein P1P64_03320 [Treponemataceae bacterium]